MPLKIIIIIKFEFDRSMLFPLLAKGISQEWLEIPGADDLTKREGLVHPMNDYAK